jgi:hypothetical protein
MDIEKLQIIDEVCSGMAILDYFNDAIIGYDIDTRKIIYSYPSIINILKTEHTLSEEEAMEYIDYNISGLHITNDEGEDITPILMNIFTYDEPLIDSKITKEEE